MQSWDGGQAPDADNLHIEKMRHWYATHAVPTEASITRQ